MNWKWIGHIKQVCTKNELYTQYRSQKEARRRFPALIVLKEENNSNNWTFSGQTTVVFFSAWRRIYYFKYKFVLLFPYPPPLYRNCLAFLYVSHFRSLWYCAVFSLLLLFCPAKLCLIFIFHVLHFLPLHFRLCCIFMSCIFSRPEWLEH